MKKRILLLTPIYPSVDEKKSASPVVHYFTKEWVKLGHEVLVIRFSVNFPSYIYKFVKPFKNLLSSIIGTEIRTWPLTEINYELDSVKIKRIPMKKIRPHSRYSMIEIKNATKKTIEFCKENKFIPDVIISHWVNPQYEIMHILKEFYKVPTCYIAHDKGHDLMTIYKKEADAYINETDIIGYRSLPIKLGFENNFKCLNKPNFLCYSGVPESFFDNEIRVFKEIRSFIYVGTLIKRKYPTSIISALSKVYGKESFTMYYVGDGYEKNNIIKFAANLGVQKNIKLLGRIPREEVNHMFKKTDVFIMISKNETFGLVYLEAMAQGCITIASRGEGVDGIIIDGKNGFLCEPGNSEELSRIILRIKSMTKEEIQEISRSAQKTAKELTDKNVAISYLNNILKIVNSN